MHREPNAFWRYSLQSYRLPGVEAACLALQDGWATDTNVLLYCCWLGSTGRPLDRRSLHRAMAAVARLQDEAIQPLRKVRRALKTRSAELPDGWSADLRKRLGAVELDLEYLEQCALFGLAQSLPALARRQPPRAAAQASIARYLALLQAAAAAPAQQHAAALLEACFPTQGDGSAQAEPGSADSHDMAIGLAAGAHGGEAVVSRRATRPARSALRRSA